MRPLLVLLLVLGAIGALLFAVFSLDSGKSKPAPVNVTSTETPTQGPTTPTELAGTKKTTRETPTTKPDTRVPNGGLANPKIQYDNKLKGSVKNTLDQPVAGAEVMLTSFGTAEITFLNDPLPDFTKAPRVRTDAEGHFTFLGIDPANRYSLVVTHPQYARKTELTSPVGETGEVELAPIILSAGATLAGYVKNEAGDTIPNAQLFLESEEYAGIGVAAPDRMTATTNAEGFYSFINVSRGRRALTVSAKGFGTLQINGIAFEKEETVGRDVTLKVSEMIAGLVVGPGNVGIPKATVIAIGVSNTQQSAQVRIETNDKGEFLFESLAPGPYNVIASAKGFRAAPRNNRVDTGSANLVIEMFKEATVCGRVVDGQGGAPVANFSVRLRFWYGSESPTQPASQEVTAVSNPQGEFCIEGVPPSDYVVEAIAEGYAPSYSGNFSVTQSKVVNGIIVKLEHGGSLTGRIVDAEGKPVARARVVTHDNEWVDDALTQVIGGDYASNATTVEVRTGEDGRFTCTSLRPDTYQIVVTAPGFTQLSRRDLRVAEGATVQVGDLKLGRGGSVRGTLFDAAGKPLAGGTINLRIADGDQPVNYSTKTGGDGKFEFKNCIPGRYKLNGMRGGNADSNPFEQLGDANSSETSIIVADNDVTTQDVRLTQ